jgi:hypothetical protein
VEEAPEAVVEAAPAARITSLEAAAAAVVMPDEPVPGVEPVVNTEPVATAEPVAAVEPPTTAEPGNVTEDQFVSTKWEVILPFSTELVEASGRSFPMISSVDSGVAASGTNPWMKEGVVIFAVNDEWVASEDDIRTFIERASAVGDNDYLNASVRIRASEGASFEHVEMSIPAMRVVELVNGTKFRASFEDGRWKSVVEEVPGNDPANQLQVGDEIISENVTAQGVRYSQSVEAFVELLARRKQPNAVFSVVRDGSVIEVTMPLATE